MSIPQSSISFSQTDMERVSPLRENGGNIGQAGVPWPERTLVEEAVSVEHRDFYMVNVQRVRELSRDQPFEAEDVLSLTYPAQLRLNTEKAENLLRYFMDLLRSTENSFRGDIEPQVMAGVLLNIVKYVNRRKFLGLDESRWPLNPFYIRVLRSMVNQVSQFKGCSFLKKDFSWKGARWYFRTLCELVNHYQRDGHGLPPQCRQAFRDVVIGRRMGFRI